MPPKHLHEEQHRGLVPTDQLGAADGTAGWVLTDDGAGFAEWMAATSSGNGFIEVDVAAVGPVDIAGGDLDGPSPTVDGVGGLGAGDRVLLKEQTDAKENGVYEITAGAPIRAADQDTGAEIWHAIIAVQQGVVNANTLWRNTNAATPTIGATNITYGSIGGTLAQVLARGNTVDGQLIKGNDAGSSLGASLQLNDAVGADGGDGFLKGGNASGGNGGAELDVYAGTSVEGGSFEGYAGNGISGKAGGDVKFYGGTGHAGAGDSAGIELGGGSAAGADGKVKVYTDATYGGATQILTADGSGFATWEDAPSGTFTPAADPGDIADPTMATAEDVAVKLNALMAAMRTAGNLV